MRLRNLRIDLLLRLWLFELFRRFNSDANLVSASGADLLELHGQRPTNDTNGSHDRGGPAADICPTAAKCAGVNSSRTGRRHEHHDRRRSD